LKINKIFFGIKFQQLTFLGAKSAVVAALKSPFVLYWRRTIVALQWLVTAEERCSE